MCRLQGKVFISVGRFSTTDEVDPAIGLIIYKDKDNVMAEYSLEKVSQPIGIAGYELSNALSTEYHWRSLHSLRKHHTKPCPQPLAAHDVIIPLMFIHNPLGD